MSAPVETSVTWAGSVWLSTAHVGRQRGYATARGFERWCGAHLVPLLLVGRDRYVRREDVVNAFVAVVLVLDASDARRKAGARG